MFFKIQILELDRHEKLINNIVENLQCYVLRFQKHSNLRLSDNLKLRWRRARTAAIISIAVQMFLLIMYKI